ncbi:MAG: hypothetical protein KJ065_23090 [Anaerolineae bacterium]|nr:hypothetical protein [Anaerolineae bacterium]
MTVRRDEACLVRGGCRWLEATGEVAKPAGSGLPDSEREILICEYNRVPFRYSDPNY